MVIKQLNLSYLSKIIGIDNFNLAKNTYDEINSDGYFQSNLTDRILGGKLFENMVNDDFFIKKSNLIEFIHALPISTQERITEDLDIDSLNEIEWDYNVSNYFINTHGLDERFKLRKDSYGEQLTGTLEFDKPEIVFKKLKKFQSSVFYNLYEYISKTPFSRCILQMPTGSGKTRTTMEVVCEIMNDTGKDVLWLANTEELCDQAFESFVEVWYFLRKRRACAINHQRSKPTIFRQEDLPYFHVATLQSLNKRNLKNKIEQFDIKDLELLIVDEAHISIAPTYKETISILINNGAKLIGLTATPGRQLSLNFKDSKQNKDLSNFYYNKRFELDTGNLLPIEYLRNEGILANATFESIEGSTIEKLLSKQEINRCINNHTIPKKVEDLLTNDTRRTAIIFDQLVQLLEQGKKILFFATSVMHSKLISTLINIKGFKSAHIDGNSGKYRRDIIDSFKKGNIQLLCNYGVLSTGFDDPKIDVVFMARPTNSIVLYSQIIGRGLRGPIIGGTDTCEIFTVFDNIDDLPNNNEIYTYFDEYFIN